MKKTILVIAICISNCLTFGQIVRDASVYDSQKGDFVKGFKDKNGNWVLKNLESAEWNSETKVGIYAKNDWSKKGVVNEYGKEIVSCKFSKIEIVKFNKGKTYLIEVETWTGDYSDGKCGFFDLKGNIVLPCEYKWAYISEFDELIDIEHESGNTHVYLPNEKRLVKFTTKYNSVDLEGDYLETWNKLEEKYVHGLADKHGKELIPCMYDYLSLEDKNYVEVEKNKKRGLVTLHNETIVPIIYDRIRYFDEDDKYIDVELSNGKKGRYSIDGKLLVECQYDDIKDANEDLFLVSKNGKWGYCSDGKEVIECKYDDATVFSSGVATVKKDGEVKLIKNPLKNADEIQIAESGNANNKKTLGGPAVSRYPAPNSDVDKNIPVNNVNQNSTTFAFIISNENYPEAPVPYALNDGRMFKEYCQKTLAIPENHIFVYEDATFGNIIAAVEKMKDISKAYDNEAELIIYYAGHGVPDEKNNSAYLLPIDGSANSVSTTGYSLAKFYSQISEMKPKSAVVFIDACFSGAKREDQMLASSRGVAVKVKNDVPQGNLVVFSAAQGDETAHQNESKGHGLFTYYLLKKLQETNGDATLGELSEYVIKQVKRQSVVINNKLQVPMVIPSQTMINGWQNMELK